MNGRWCAVVLLAVALAGCTGDTDDGTSAGPNIPMPGGPPARQATAAEAAPITIEAGVAAINGENTTIGFLGTKAGGQQHTGGFTEFTGEITVDSDAITGISVEIQTASLWSDSGQLTGHLKQPDFFDVNEYPTAKFESTSIEAGGDGKFSVTGNLTLHGETNEVSFPATAKIADDTLTFSGKLKIDRTTFGMNYKPDVVNPEVAITFAVGVKPSPPPAQGGGRGRGGPGGGGGRRGAGQQTQPDAT